MIDFEPSIDSSSSLQNHFFSKSLLPQVQNILETKLVKSDLNKERSKVIGKSDGKKEITFLHDRRKASKNQVITFLLHIWWIISKWRFMHLIIYYF